MPAIRDMTARSRVSGGNSGFGEGIAAESAVDMSSLLEREAFLRPAECRQARLA